MEWRYAARRTHRVDETLPGQVRFRLGERVPTAGSKKRNECYTGREDEGLFEAFSVLQQPLQIGAMIRLKYMESCAVLALSGIVVVHQICYTTYKEL